ncbi:MAG TPA: efflux RND transporter permease subunit, partial [Nitrospira sp.]|nr:efflux RND transporter permease subunit [Nitrospira sp.]
MNISATFIQRPVATTLLTVGVTLVGIVAFRFLPVAALPQVEFPTINVSASLPGGSPETMATSVAAPLEHQFARIAGVTEMTSSSSLGSSSITLQFELSRDIDGAARDVQAAIMAASSDLPANLPSKPTYRKINPADAPVLILSLTSDIVSRGRMYDVASSILQQKLSQIDGVGQVYVGGGSLPAVRIDLNPTALNKYGIGLGDIRQMLSRTNVNRPKGQLSDGSRTWEIRTNDQLHSVEDYLPLIVSYREGRAVRLSDVATVEHSVEDVRTMGVANGTPAVLIIINRQPGANIIETVDRVRAILPQLEASIPGSMTLSVVVDRTPVIRASLHDVERTLAISVLLVILVVFLFLRDARATLIPCVAVPVSLISTFGVMYLFGYSLDNLSLMALTIATGFVVDDAIVVLENISRYREQGMDPMRAALRGAREITFTVLSMTLSLVAVFLPILLMGGMMGRLFREFAVTLSVAILVSLAVSLTTTPMMCARVLKSEQGRTHGRWYRLSERFFEGMRGGYARSLTWVLRHPRGMLALTLATMAFSVYLYTIVPKGFFPQQDTGRMFGNIQAAQDISFQAMRQKLTEVVDIIKSDPAVDTVTGFSGGGSGNMNSGRMFIGLKPLHERQVSVDQVIARLRPKLAKVPGAPTVLQAIQDLRIGGRASSAQYQYTLQSVDLAELNTWGPKVERQLRTLKEITDVNSDQQDKGLQSLVVFDRSTASRLGLSPQLIDDTLYDAFGQRQVSILYTPLNQYHVVMEVAPQYWQDPSTLQEIYVRSRSGSQVPLSAVARFEPTNTLLLVNHQGQFPGVTLSFNITPGASLGNAVQAIEQSMREIGLPAGVQGSFQGAAKAFQASLE